MEIYFNKIREASLRLTEPRKSLISILLEADRPLSAEEILDRSTGGELDLVTIYRNLNTLCEIDLALGIQLESGKSIYELAKIDSDEHNHHHHVICRQCHNVVCIDVCFAHELEKYASGLGFSDLKHTFEIYGLCKACSKTRDAASKVE